MMFEIRDATEMDAPLAAWVTLAAIGLSGEPSPRLQRVCAERDTLYSWEHMRVITADGIPVGGLIAYPGAEYARLRAKTWPRCWDEDPAELASVDQECTPGEFYLDSMAILPEYRGNGLGRILLLDAVAKGAEQGFDEITLIADKQHPGVVNYYEDTGFQIFGTMSFFGHDYWKMRFVK